MRTWVEYRTIATRGSIQTTFWHSQREGRPAKPHGLSPVTPDDGFSHGDISRGSANFKVLQNISNEKN